MGTKQDIQPKVNRVCKNCFSLRLYRDMNALKRLLWRLKGFRRSATRCDRLATGFLPPSTPRLSSHTGYEFGAILALQCRHQPRECPRRHRCGCQSPAAERSARRETKLSVIFVPLALPSPRKGAAATCLPAPLPAEPAECARYILDNMNCDFTSQNLAPATPAA